MMGSRILFLKKGTRVSEPRPEDGSGGHRREDWSRNDILGVESVANAGTHISGQMCASVEAELNYFLSEAKAYGSTVRTERV